ncbi:hypothetical protein QVD17_02675 [Tagetes erecta]|uniref:Uncharacterized protein n=1 Tax=Tagetes erecta TaxID=13708 RepID=A0AAD8P9D6_TARER|nr:hypothetical protein QVD17_02675 [Tagetes erecta]
MGLHEQPQKRQNLSRNGTDTTAMADGRSKSTKSHQEEEAKGSNLIEKGKEMIKPKGSPTHDKETHGTSNDIDEDTPIEKVKGPGVIERAKEEVEALVEAAVHPNK